mmetsp:Transcript_19004/g.26655  ORF Transcript_19004/g.26655 Transcript_19004/m.26655 type:complete len:770 (-) Transcript_19004:231-2540(-)
MKAIAVLSLAAFSHGTRLDKLATSIHPHPSHHTEAHPTGTKDNEFGCNGLKTCFDCFSSGCFWQPSAVEGQRCSAACMITNAKCFGTFHPYEVPAPFNVITCPGMSNKAAAAAKHSKHMASGEHNLAWYKAELALKTGAGHSASSAARAAIAKLHKSTHKHMVKDVHGCSKAVGTSWCEALNRCIKHFEEHCPAGSRCSAHLNCEECTKHNCFFSPDAHGQAKCSHQCLMENGSCFGTFSPVMIPPPHNHVACPARHLVKGPDAHCRSATTCEECYAFKCFWTPEAHTNYNCNHDCPVKGAACFGTFDAKKIAPPHNDMKCPSMIAAEKKAAQAHPTPKGAFTCAGDTHKWAKAERAWCCHMKKKGCVHTVDCHNKKHAEHWSPLERRYCCATYHTGCEPVPETIAVHPWPETGLSRSKDGWRMDNAGGFMISDPKNLQVFVKFSPVLADADYKIELSFPSTPSYARAAILQVEAVEGRQVGVVDQTKHFFKSEDSKPNWHSVGVYHLNMESTVVLSTSHTSNGPLVISGIRFTPVNVQHHDHKVVAAKKAKKTAKTKAKPHTLVTKPMELITPKGDKVLVCAKDAPVSFEVFDSNKLTHLNHGSPVRVGCVGAFSIKATAKPEVSSATPFAVRFFATVVAEKTGEYFFNVTASCKAHLHVDGVHVVNPAMTISDDSASGVELALKPHYGKIHLKEGLHKLELDYFDEEHPQQPYLDVFYTAPHVKGSHPLSSMLCKDEKCAEHKKKAIAKAAKKASSHKTKKTASKHH